VTPTDSELIARSLIDRDAGAFGALVRRHQSAVRRFLRHLAGGDAALADDLAQETFIGAYRGLANFRAGSRFETWLLGIAYNRFRSFRRRRRGDIPPPEAPPDEAPGPSTESLSDLRQDLASAMGRLSEDERLAIRLCFQFGLSHAEVAEAVGWPLGTAKTHIARGKDRLRELLSAWNPRT
jgi:RNA polymerase sigma factor (sigma-70 family)